MWHTYNLITTGDQIRASTVRKVPSCHVWFSVFPCRLSHLLIQTSISQQIDLVLSRYRKQGQLAQRRQSASSAFSSRSLRLRLFSPTFRITLTIEVDKVHFEPQAGILRLTGRNASENKFVKVRLCQRIPHIPERENHESGESVCFLRFCGRWAHISRSNSR